MFKKIFAFFGVVVILSLGYSGEAFASKGDAFEAAVKGTLRNSDDIGRGSSRATRLSPAQGETGLHPVKRTNADGNVTRYEVYTPNPKNPTGFDRVKAVDTQYSKSDPHYNKITKEHVPVPHVTGTHIPGGVRPAHSWELPK